MYSNDKCNQNSASNTQIMLSCQSRMLYFTMSFMFTFEGADVFLYVYLIYFYGIKTFVCLVILM